MVMSSKPTTFRSAVDIAQSLTDDAILIGTLKAATGRNEPSSTEIVGHGGEKRKWINEGNNNQNQANKKPTGNSRAYVATAPTGPKPYLGNKPKCDKCGKHHAGDCAFCQDCRNWGHLAQNCKTNPNPRQNNGCFECGEPGHYRNQCPRHNNNNNRIANVPNARGRAYIIGARDAPVVP